MILYCTGFEKRRGVPIIGGIFTTKILRKREIWGLQMQDGKSVSTHSNNTRKGLLIAYYYYQKESPASKRTRGLLEYLPEFGWEVTLITPQLMNTPESAPNIIPIKEQMQHLYDIFVDRTNSLNSVHDGISKKDTNGNNSANSIIKAYCWKVLKTLINTQYISLLLIFIYRKTIAKIYLHGSWHKDAVKAGINEVKNNNYSIILSTQCPMSAHEIARDIQAQTNLPWVADYRDLFSQWGLIHSHESQKEQKKNYRYEVNLIKSADYLTVVSEPWAKELETQHQKPVSVIPNGFDPEIINPGTPLSKKFSILHSGAIYSRKRTLKPLLSAIRELIDEKSLDETDVELNFYGPMEKGFWEEVDTYSLGDCVKYHGIASHEQTLQNQRESQILLLLTADDPIDVGCYPAKIFEYLAAMRPIISYGYPHQCVISALLEDTNAGYHLVTNEAIKEQIRIWYKEYKTNGAILYHGDAARIDSYGQRGMAQKFAEVLNTVVEHHK